MPSDPIRGWAPVLRTEYASLEFARLLKQIRKNAGLRSWNHDVGGEYAVYMMAWGRKTPAEPAFGARIPQKWTPVLRSEYAQNY